MKKLPIGIQDYEKLIRNDCIYADKAAYIHYLLKSGGETFFLSCPRRFGKSLLLSTIKTMMEVRKELFEACIFTIKSAGNRTPSFYLIWEARPMRLLKSLKTRSLQESIIWKMRKK